ncbi:putative membrane protein YdbT with pleckstrin-like domain [Leifsonia sp. AK011]|uniref:PH domain-containing protein n=1 Tax=Leifsonia sp. AK011 TaxID=2723075 RepID=UPI0015CA8419|nr:PH domain-containing protein [Leifsonia sp. AK011]NYF11568.1 putative membrane protein YdbT with pleckstrin-like domain [Leifsonia sp. AK011]
MRTSDGEWVVARLRSHGRALFWPTLLLLLVSGGIGFGYGRLPEEWQNLAILGAAALIVLVGCVGPWVRWMARTITITSERIILRSGVLVRERQEVRHSRIEEVAVRRSGLQLVFATGDVLLHTGASRPVVLRDVSSPKLVAEAIDDLVDDAPGEDWDDDEYDADGDFPETSIR